MALVAFTGFARSGKDTAAARLVERHGFNRLAFADPMREALLRLNPTVVVHEDDLVSMESASGTRHPEFALYSKVPAIPIRALVVAFGWDLVKSEIPEVRELLQRLGTQVGRELFGENFWVEQLFRRAHREGKLDRLVITDCRFENEAHAVLDRGGIVVRVARPGVGPVNAHESDRGLPDHLVTETVSNDGTIEELSAKVDHIAWRELAFSPVSLAPGTYTTFGDDAHIFGGVK